MGGVAKVGVLIEPTSTAWGGAGVHSATFQDSGAHETSQPIHLPSVVSLPVLSAKDRPFLHGSLERSTMEAEQ